jgi:hypothetical protein
MSGLSFTVKADEAPVLEDPDEMDRSNYLEYISVEDLGAKVTHYFDKRLNLLKKSKETQVERQTASARKLDKKRDIRTVSR